MFTMTDEIAREEGEQAVTSFLSSFEWLYLTHRYPRQAQGRLLRLLTLSGLAPSRWAWFSGQLIMQAPQTHVTHQVIGQAEMDPAHLTQAVEEIWTFATQTGLPVGKPPLCPLYLTAYDYTQDAYWADLRIVYGEPLFELDEHPWPAQPPLPQQSTRQLHFLHQAMAMMGTTARVIDWLVERGTQRGHENQSNHEPV
jgi:hypothetical protein